MKTLATFLAGFMLSGGLLATWRAYDQPDCPTEDSCTVQYEHGKWHISEATP